MTFIIKIRAYVNNIDIEYKISKINEKQLKY